MYYIAVKFIHSYGIEINNKEDVFILCYENYLSRKIEEKLLEDLLEVNTNNKLF